MANRLLARVDAAVRTPLTLASLGDRLAAMWGDRAMVEESTGRRLTFDEAAELVVRWSNAVAASTEPGERVVLATDNTYDQFLLCLAVARAGRLPVPVNSQMKPAEIDHVVADSQASLILRSADDLALDAPACVAATPASDDVAALFYTSGTTGKPKGAALTHEALIGQAGYGALAPTGIADIEVVLALPVAHIFGFVMLLSTATAGIQVFFMGRFRAEDVLDQIERRGATGFVGVPAMYRMLIEAGATSRNLKSVRFWGSGADAMPTELAKTFKRLGASASLPLIGPVGEATFIEGYGMVEIGGGAAIRISLPSVPERFGQNIAIKLPGYKFRVVDEAGTVLPKGALGELQLRGPGVLKEYWNSPEATRGAMTDDGWLRTGDLVRLSHLGTITFCGRQKHVIKSGGYSVYPLEVETVIDEHPDVIESALVAKNDRKLGSVPAAAVRLRPGASISSDELVAWVEERVARYKAPRSIVFVDELPRTGTAKVQRDQLEELFR